MADRKLRRAQALTPSGVGAIIDILGESFVAEDTSRWQGKWELLKAPRIAQYFHTPDLRTPPAAEETTAGLPYLRFPQWLFCGQCRQMTRWNKNQEKPGEPAKCQICKGRPQLVPMRFVAVCGNGHLEDVPWVRWAHSRATDASQRQCGMENLEFIHLTNVGGGLESLVARCKQCKAQRNLRELPAPGALKNIGLKCLGRQPWQAQSERVSCDQDLIVLQRGASSVHFPVVKSALDIPPDSNWVSWGGPMEQLLANKCFTLVLEKPDAPALLIDNLLKLAASEVGMSVMEVKMALDLQLGTSQDNKSADDGEAMQVREWKALVNPADSYDPRDYFISRQVPMPSPFGHHALQPFAETAAERLSQVVIVDRLREIRVLTGFHRHTMNKTVGPALGKKVNFLPAIEVFGEGVFLRINETELEQWESSQAVINRANILRRRLAASFQAKWVEDEPSPRMIMIHTLAHLLMRQMSFDAGYSASSLKERIYAGTDPEFPLGGLLIYTGAGDSEGSLGGLARLGEPERLIPVVARALGAAQWCSLDPVCGESKGQGTEGLSLAACHACALAAETSCTHGNVLLDRKFLVDPEIGFFHTEVTRLLAIQSSESLT